ncbi:PREDICTED: serine palmitoyltransferase 1-like [Priapulus caudatus]|uniref:Serine palmitoyltransferase 1 n=1 Tax=Priapulus caudatus TaxID=37621 RepID=A0ABM1EZV8_PRICU|nr:PREDICTED: serine palmitoyltransferase 1-like [Priapulus caudatus]
MAGDWYLYEVFQAFLSAPAYHLLLEAFLVLWILRLILTKSYKPHKTRLGAKEKEELIAEWTPEPLVPDTPSDHYTLHPRVVDGKPGKTVTINGKKILNMGTLNFLNMIENKAMEEAAITSLKTYGVGSCGPRGFYGTVDAHLQLEDKLAKFLGVEEAVLYSFGFSTISSAIPAYAKRGDVLFVDAGVSFAIQQGIAASRSHVRYFKHNDVDDLKRLLQLQADTDSKHPKRARVIRKFVIVEGLYLNYGDICPLPELVAIKQEYCVRLFVEESLSFGVLGASGKGVTEHFGISVDEVDLICGSLENALAAIGGFCCGKSYVIDHQRLSGLGYCFSASMPPMIASAAITSLEQLENNPDIFSALVRNSRWLHEKISSIPGVEVGGDPISPVKHISLKDCGENGEQETRMLEEIVQEAENQGVALTVARYLHNEEAHPLRPSIRLAVSSSLTQPDLTLALRVISNACASVHRRDLDAVE